MCNPAWPAAQRCNIRMHPKQQADPLSTVEMTPGKQMCEVQIFGFTG